MSIKGLIAGYRAELNVTPRELAAVAGIAPSEYYKKLKNASLWRLGEINAIYTFLNIPQEERIYE